MSNLDREVWEEFHANPTELIPVSQQRFDALFVDSEEKTTEVIPGIALNRLHDAAFDQALIAFDDALRLLLSKRLRDALPNEALKVSFAEYEGQALHLPDDAIPPDAKFLASHRKRFKAALHLASAALVVIDHYAMPRDP